MPLWRAGGWRSSELWWNLTADLCCHKRTGETYKSVKTEPHKTRELLAKSYNIKVLSSFFPQHLDVLHPFWTQHSHATFTCHYKNTFFKVYTVSALPASKNVTAHICASVDVGSEPHRFVPGRAPPRFTRYAGWVGRDAGLSGIHVAVHFDGVLHTALVWIHPVLPYRTKWSGCGTLTVDHIVDLLYSCYAMKNATVILQVSRFGSQFKGI